MHLALAEAIPAGRVLDFGCGDGRLAEAFEPGRYCGVDINPHAIAACRRNYPGRRFELAETELPLADCALAYAVLLHVPDEELAAVIDRLARAVPRVVVVEILGRHWRGTGLPMVFNRELHEYVAAFAVAEMALQRSIGRPYHRYGGATITFMDFRDGSLRDAP